MKQFLRFFYLLILIVWIKSETLNSSLASTEVIENENERPIIGVLSQEVSYALEQTYPGMYNSYIAASYVKFVEGAGARVVPIWIGQEEKYYEVILSKVNGVLFPGGGTWFNQSKGYSDAGEYIYKIAKRINMNGVYFPLWGTCLGFELLTYLSANRKEHRADCRSNKQALPLEFKNDFRASKMFESASSEVISILEKEYVTSNFHQFCVTEKNLTLFELDDEWRVLSVNKDFDGLEFISSIESKKYPFYGTQFHPEKNLYEWIEKRNISHTKNAIVANRYFAEFFINEARKNNHKFEDLSEEESYLIYNFPATYTGIKGSAFEQCYFFA